MTKLGDKVKCEITGFAGVATQRLEKLGGSVQFYVEGRDNGSRRDEWLEEARLGPDDEQAPGIGFTASVMARDSARYVYVCSRPRCLFVWGDPPPNETCPLCAVGGEEPSRCVKRVARAPARALV